MKQSTLKAQALRRWETLPRSEQMALLAELATHAPGSAAIELDEIFNNWPNRARSKGRVVEIGFGTDTSQREKRYLFKSDIPKE